MRKLLYTFLTISLIIVLSSCGSSQNNNQNDTAGGNNAGNNNAGGNAAVDVQAVYNQNCMACHGAELEGKMGGNTNLQKVGSKLSPDQIKQQITNGGNGMPAFGSKLDEAEIDALTAWLSEKK